MTRIATVAALATLLPTLAAQDRPVGTLPPGPPPGPADLSYLVNALVVQANMVADGEVMVLAPVDEPDPKKPPPPPAVFLKVDGKAVRAFGTDRKPLDIAELNRRLSIRAPAVVVHGQPPDPFFLKVLHERSVVFVVPKKVFDQLARAAGGESLQGWWSEVKPGETARLANDRWIIEGKRVSLHRGGKLEVHMAYAIDASGYPKTIDLTPDRGPAKGKVLKGIYELDGNTLKVCYVSPDAAEPDKAERPREFGTKGAVMVVFQRLPP